MEGFKKRKDNASADNEIAKNKKTRRRDITTTTTTGSGGGQSHDEEGEESGSVSRVRCQVWEEVLGVWGDE